MGGRLLGGRYEVGETLGRGGMAEVHLGRDIRLDRDVAIKLLRSDLARDPHFLSRFRREAQSAAGLTHPSIVAIFDSGQDEVTAPDGSRSVVPYIVMEYVEGRTLRHVLTEVGQLAPDESARVTQGVLDALSYSHKMGIVHRDIKPANVMITPAGAVKVMDFGIARAIADAEATMTQTSAVMGTAQYLSPEQAQGRSVDARSDLYSAGCLLFELLTGRPPFVAETPVALAYQHVGERPVPPSSLVPGLPPAYDAVVLHALTKDREQRYQTAAQFRADLSALRSHQPVSDAAMASLASYAAGGDGGVARSGPGGLWGAGGAGGAGGGGAGGAGAGAGGAGAGVAVVDTAALPSIDTRAQHARRRRRGPAYLGLGVAVLAALAVLGYLFGRGFWADGAAETVAVPYVITMTEGQARSAILARGLVPVVTTLPDEDVPKGQVFKQDPAKDAKVSPGASVRITVSAGRSQVVVPDVRGATAESATQTLALSNLAVTKVIEVDDPSQDKGRVVETDPPSGQTVETGSSVILRVASGKVAVPDLYLMDKAAAAAELTRLNLTMQVAEYVVDDTVAPDSVLSQDPAKGQLVEVGSVVKIRVAKASPVTTTVTIPPSTTTTTPSSSTTTTTTP